MEQYENEKRNCGAQNQDGGAPTGDLTSLLVGLESVGDLESGGGVTAWGCPPATPPPNSRSLADSEPIGNLDQGWGPWWRRPTPHLMEGDLFFLKKLYIYF
ncbi:hypothetical protein CRG98_022721 [Punica granatum]|uniref:Uncharacterized protein n=1 Tax=Punica granatum TaxID=22663 RepID=A0A2I0JKU6_PUNGR|nr:hypothetical protein CRG98_022721 [Punica granatum]